MEKINLNIFTTTARERFIVERDAHQIAEDATNMILYDEYGDPVDDSDFGDPDPVMPITLSMFSIAIEDDSKYFVDDDDQDDDQDDDPRWYYANLRPL